MTGSSELVMVRCFAKVMRRCVSRPGDAVDDGERERVDPLLEERG